MTMTTNIPAARAGEELVAAPGLASAAPDKPNPNPAFPYSYRIPDVVKNRAAWHAAHCRIAECETCDALCDEGIIISCDACGRVHHTDWLGWQSPDEGKTVLCPECADKDPGECTTPPRPAAESYWFPLFGHLFREHGLTLTDSELDAVATAVDTCRGGKAPGFTGQAMQSAGGHARAAKLTAEERSAIARKAAKTRWKKRHENAPLES